MQDHMDAKGEYKMRKHELIQELEQHCHDTGTMPIQVCSRKRTALAVLSPCADPVLTLCCPPVLTLCCPCSSRVSGLITACAQATTRADRTANLHADRAHHGLR